MDTNDKTAGQAGSDKIMKYGMWACCAVMLLPLGAFLVSGGASGGAGGLATLAPIVLCVGAHLVMHRFMGKSCHGKAEDAETKAETPDPRATVRVAAE